MVERRRNCSFAQAAAEARASFVAAVNRADATRAARVYTVEARLLAPSAELIEGRQAIEAFWRAGLEAGISDIELEMLALGRESRLAFEIGRYALRLEPPDAKPVPVIVRMTIGTFV